MTNKYLEKIAFDLGVGKKLGTFAKNITGESVREARTAANLHSSINSQRESVAKSFKRVMDTGPVSATDKIRHEAHASGMAYIHDIAKQNVPNVGRSVVDHAVHARNSARLGTVAVATGAGTAALASKNKGTK